MAYINFKYDLDNDGIALVTWDMPDKSMNVFTQEVMRELDLIIDVITADAGVKGVVFTSGKESFSGGADLTMLQSMLDIFEREKAKNEQEAVQILFTIAGQMTWLFRKIETCGKPWVAAINGVCMGGAFELALSCHWRIVSDNPKLKLALPEVKVGIFPGAGGTQRVSRLCNPQDALQMMTTGKSLSASRAKSMGLVHEIVSADQLIIAAKNKIIAGLKPTAPWDEKGYKLQFPVYSKEGAQLWPAASAMLRRETQLNYPGITAVIKCVYEGLLLPFDLALKVEQRYFISILRSPSAKMMIRSLFVSLQELNKGARRPLGLEPNKLQKIGVIGAGFMGAGIAYVSAKAGLHVVLIDQDLISAERGRKTCEDLIGKDISKGYAKESDKQQLLSLIKASTDNAELSDCDLVIEAVFEDRNVKNTVITNSDAVMASGAILASNTSTLPISSLALASSRPNNFTGIHFFSPVEKMALVEIIKGEKTSDKAISVALDYVKLIKKTPIVVNDSRGFYVNRCVLRYMSEAYNMLIEGVPAIMIENAAKMAGMPIGPLALNDETALDLSQRILNMMVRDLGTGAVLQAHIDLVNIMVDSHARTGRKSGKGFYDYPPKPFKKHLWEGLKELFPQKSIDQIDVFELKQRFVTVIALEAARVMEEGIVDDPREADVGSILAFGFAPFTGGVLSYIDGMGAAQFVTQCHKLRAKFGDQFKVSALLEDMARKGTFFYPQHVF
jgi:3-hydroxyacyl-CoA dehydrogenase / enoyl-CoA hydratase / 3-hydroxybutyryl-CoA epimerase